MNSKKSRSAGKPYNKWSQAEKTQLIKIRIELDDLFTSKNANMNNAWRCVAERFGDPTKNFKVCRQLWKNVCQKYKSFFEQHTGDGAGDDAPTNRDMESWPYFKMFHEYASKKHNYHPPYLIDSSLGTVSMASTSAIPEDISEPSPSPSSSSMQEFSFPPVDSPTFPITSSSRLTTSNTPRPVPATKISAYEKYCMKRDKKLTKQMGAIMAVFGQMVAKDYPDINVNNLLICSSSEED